MGRFLTSKNSGRGRSNPSSHKKKSYDNNKFYPLGMGNNKAKQIEHDNNPP